jgi:hypothetical protein
MDAMSPPLCATLSELADETWTLMSFGLARTDSREPDERTFTDHNFLHLERLHASETRIWLFDGSVEALTGADVEWWVGDGSTYVRMLVQAKRLNRKDQYAEVGRDIGQTGIRQIDRLVEICEHGLPQLSGGTAHLGLTPVYIFYNGDLRTSVVPQDGCGNPGVSRNQRGCVVSHARTVKTILDTRRRRRTLPRGEIAAYTLPWQCLLCCPRRTGDPASLLADALRQTTIDASRAQLPLREESSAFADDVIVPQVRIWRLDELPLDPRTAPDEPEDLLALVAADEWRPGGRLLAVSTITPSDEHLPR